MLKVARKEEVSEQLIGRWEADFLEAGKAALQDLRGDPHGGGHVDRECCACLCGKARADLGSLAGQGSPGPGAGEGAVAAASTAGCPGVGDQVRVFGVGASQNFG